MSGCCRATSSDALRELSGYVHDTWFSLEGVEHTPASDHVRIDLLRGAVVKERFGWQAIVMGREPAGALIIRNVRAIEVDDEPEIDAYEVDYLTATRDGEIVQLHATIPLRIDFRVDSIDVEFVPAAEGC